MDGRITALRVGFLSSSHQLAGLNFLLPALLSTTQGLCPFIGIFAIFFLKCWSRFSVWQFWLWSSSSFFLTPLTRLRVGDSEAQRLRCRAGQASLVINVSGCILHGCFFFPPLLVREIWATDGLDWGAVWLRLRVAPDRNPNCAFFFFLTYRVFMAAVCVCVCFFF